MLFDKLESVISPDRLAKRDYAQEAGAPVFSDSRYSPVPLSESNFRPLAAKAGRVCAVDGGNCELASSPSFALALVRVFSVSFEGAKRAHSEQHDFICGTASRVSGGKVFLDSKLAALGPSDLAVEIAALSVDSQDASLAPAGFRASPSAMAGMYRRYLEWALAGKKLAAEPLVVRDGTLQTSVSGEGAFAQAAFARAEENGNILCALAKTSSLLATTGMPLVDAIRRMAPAGSWVYHPVVRNEHPDHKAEIYACKLHPQAKHAFRFELLRGQDLGPALENLAFLSNDPVFLGYPHALSVADSHARVSFAEASVARAVAESKFGVSFDEFERASDAHDWLV